MIDDAEAGRGDDMAAAPHALAIWGAGGYSRAERLGSHLQVGTKRFLLTYDLATWISTPMNLSQWQSRKRCGGFRVICLALGQRDVE